MGGETEAHSSHKTVPHRKEVAKHGEVVLSLPHHSTFGPVVLFLPVRAQDSQKEFA